MIFMWDKLKSIATNSKTQVRVGLAIVLIFLGGYNLFFIGDSQGRGEDISFEVKTGMTTEDIAQDLQSHGIINNTLGFRILARLEGKDTKFKNGIYYFRVGMTNQSVLDQLVKGPANQVVRVTIPEGYTVEDIANLLEKENLVSKEDFCKVAKDFAPYEYMKPALDNKDIKYSVEGFLFPDTYDFDKSYTAKQIMQIMVDNFDSKLSTEMRAQAKAEDLSIFKLVTMASLVEREAKFEEDRPIIADVFFKRLKDGMKLQSDATIQYALDEHKEEFSIEDTKYESPYNTYLHEGLTPGPIGNPGLDSIKAVLNPKKTDYLYFVADKDGHNHYSVTYDEHLKVIDEIYGSN